MAATAVHPGGQPVRVAAHALDEDNPAGAAGWASLFALVVVFALVTWAIWQ